MYFWHAIPTSFVRIFHASSAHTGGGTDTKLTDIKVDKRVGLDGLFFFLPYYSILVFAKFLPIILILLSDVLLIMPIIPSLNTIHRAPNIDSCYIDSPTNCTNIQ